VCDKNALLHLLILHEKQLQRVLYAYVAYFNRARPHQGIQQRIPEAGTPAVPLERKQEPIISIPVLGGLHHDYRRAA
jgi:putative transposase